MTMIHDTMQLKIRKRAGYTPQLRMRALARASVKDGNGNGNEIGNWKLEMVLKHGNDR